MVALPTPRLDHGPRIAPDPRKSASAADQSTIFAAQILTIGLQTDPPKETQKGQVVSLGQKQSCTSSL
jgi:hypothetical protein